MHVNMVLVKLFLRTVNSEYGNMKLLLPLELLQKHNQEL